MAANLKDKGNISRKVVDGDKEEARVVKYSELSTGVRQRVASRNTEGEAVSTWVKLLSEKVNSNNIGGQLSIINADDNRLALSVIVYSEVFGSKEGDYVGYHALTLEGSGQPLEDETVQIGNRQINAVRVAGDAYESTTIGIIEAHLAQRYPDAKLVNCGGMVIFNETPADTESASAILYNASNAIISTLNYHVETEPKLMVETLKSFESLDVNFDFSGAQALDASGMPIRSDFVLRTTGRNGKSASVHNKPTPLARVNGFCEPFYVGNTDDKNPTAIYRNNVIITQVVSEHTQENRAWALFGLCSVDTLVRDLRWTGAYDPRMVTGGNVDPLDLAGIGYEWGPTLTQGRDPEVIPTGAPLPVRGNACSDEERIELITKAFHTEEVGIFLQVRMNGPSNWMQMSFVEAADPKHPNHADAVDGIMNDVSDWIGKDFGDYFNAKEPMFSLITEEHFGYYTDESGERADRSNINYRACLNLMGEQEKDVASSDRAWVSLEETYFGNDDFDLQLDRRNRIIDALTGRTSVIKDRGYLLEINPVFLDALFQASSDAGLELNPRHPGFTPSRGRHYNTASSGYRSDNRRFEQSRRSDKRDDRGGRSARNRYL